MSYYDSRDRERGASRDRDRRSSSRDRDRDLDLESGGDDGTFIIYAFVAYDTKILAECVSPLRGENARQDALIERGVSLAHKVLRRIVKKTDDHKKTFVSDKFSFHYIMEGGLVYLVVTPVDHPQRLAFAFLRDVKAEWNRQYTYRECVSAPPSHMTSEFLGTFRRKMIQYSEQSGGRDYDDRDRGRSSSRDRDRDRGDRDWGRGGSRGRDDRDRDWDRGRGRGGDRDLELDDLDYPTKASKKALIKQKLSGDPTDNKFCRNIRVMCWGAVCLVVFMAVTVYITGYFVCHGILWQNCFAFLFTDYF